MLVPNRDLTYLLRIVESIGKILVYAEGFTDPLNFFEANDQKEFNASLMLLINIGEQSTRLSESLKNTNTTIQWQDIKNFRNRVAHDYTGLDKFMVYDIIKDNLPMFKVQLESILRTELLSESFDVDDYLLAKNSNFYPHIDFDTIY